MEAINSFINRLTIEDKDTLYCPSSGAPVPSNVDNEESPQAVGSGQAYRQNRQLSRACEKAKSKKLLFANLAKTSLVQGKARKNIEITAERNVLGQEIRCYII